MKLNLFEFYLEHFFKLPSEIKNDLIYCQRALKAHVKVHQMVIDVFQQQENSDPEQKKRILEEIETEMYEINAEQQFLFLRLRRVIDEFYKVLTKNKVPMDMNATNAYISKTIIAGVNDVSIEVKPVTVQLRHTELNLVQKYFEVQKPSLGTANNAMEVREEQYDDDLQDVVEVKEEPKIIYEIVSSDEESEPVIPEKMPRKQELKQIIKVDLTNESTAPLKNGNGNHFSQMSLLKPMAQRLTKTAVKATAVDVRGNDAAHFIPIDVDAVKEERCSPEILARTTASNNVTPPHEEPSTSTAATGISSAVIVKNETSEEPHEFFVSKNVKMSRLNLRQALKKARTENMAAKAAANILATRAPAVDAAKAPTTSPPKRVTPPKRTTPPKRNSPTPKRFIPTPPPPPPVATTAAVAAPAALKKVVKKIKATRGAAAAKAVPTNSSSEDSHHERTPTPSPPPPPAQPSTSSQSMMSSEPQDTRTQPEHYGQEMFLRIFQLYTPEMQVQMQQRRSKRKRRTVYSNERADFHYGRIEYGSAPSTEDTKKKQRKSFLLSPQIKRGRKRASADTKTDEAVVPSRSSSSSPDEKRGCNECLKGGGCLEQCVECKGFYHQMCHREEDLCGSSCVEEDASKPRTSAKGASPTNNKTYLCPACQRTQKKFLSKEKQQNQTLHSTAQLLKSKMAKEKSRRDSLQHTSKMFKIQMRNLFNIVNVIKSDQENDDSSD